MAGRRRRAGFNKRFTTLRRAFRLARQADPPKVGVVPTFPRLPEHNAREGFFDKADFFAVLGHLPDDGLRDFVEWAYWTGRRKGEIAKLTWAAFDAQTWTLTLPGRITKNGKPRKVVLTGPFRAIIERRLAVRRLDCPLIFWRLYTGKPTKRLQPGQPTAIVEFRKLWASACKAAGVSGKLFHDLRRSAVRNLRRAGVDRRVAMKLSGHRTESIFERYNIDTDDDLRDAAEKLTTYVEQLPNDRKVVPLRTA
ncbi:MAG TPA: site-specific integrase [Candidatus Binatia bacterium]|nr:site-specific integrase [Candidatus Binatia bacterium]